MSAHSGALEAIERVLNRGGEADDILRQVVAILHERLGRYTRINFVEADGRAPGPVPGLRSRRRPPFRSPSREVASPTSKWVAS